MNDFTHCLRWATSLYILYSSAFSFRKNGKKRSAADDWRLVTDGSGLATLLGSSDSFSVKRTV